MSNHKMQFPFHISKSWLSVCIFIFLLAVCVGLAIHVTSKKENAICSDSDNSELPIVSNENVSEESGSDIEYAKNYVPTEEDVLAARQQATEGMSQQQIENLTEVVKAANLWLEQKYMNEDLFEKLSDPNNLYWNYFHQTGEIQIGWVVDGDIDIDAVCEREKLSIGEDTEGGRRKLQPPDFIGKREPIRSRVFLIGERSHSRAPPSVCLVTHWMNASLGTTILLPTFSTGKAKGVPAQTQSVCVGRGGAAK